VSAKQTCKRKEAFTDLEQASIAARHIRRKHGLSRRSRDVLVYICDHCSLLHVGTALTPEQRKAGRNVAQRWAEMLAKKASETVAG